MMYKIAGKAALCDVLIVDSSTTKQTEPPQEPLSISRQLLILLHFFKTKSPRSRAQAHDSDAISDDLMELLMLGDGCRGVVEVESSKAARKKLFIDIGLQIEALTLATFDHSFK